MLQSALRRPYLIGIAGPSGAGKTTLAQRLARELQAPILALDYYYRGLDAMPLAERARVNFDHPAALDRGLLLEQLAALAAGAAIRVPVYDFARHTRTSETVPLRAAGFTIVEGLFALHWEDVRALLGTRVFIEADDAVCFARRLERDTRERGRSAESVREQYVQTVRAMAERYVLPARVFADVVVSGTEPLEDCAAAVLAHVETNRAPVAGR